jgi:hypothetical protein
MHSTVGILALLGEEDVNSVNLTITNPRIAST